MKETQEQRLARIREAWRPWKEKIDSEHRTRRRVDPVGHVRVKGMENGNNRGRIRDLLRTFWEGWEKLDSDALRLASLVVMANKFQVRVTEKRLRKMRKKYNRNKHNLLNIPNEKCATCDKRSRVRHHIIPLTVGGLNIPLNLILICHGCHAEIHPWMKND